MANENAITGQWLPTEAVICPYCNQTALLVTGEAVYPHLPWLYSKQFYQCAPCNAYVGCHEDGRPLGRLANAELRLAKIAAHAAFDPLWKSHQMTRTAAYRWLARELGIRYRSCHIGNFSPTMCRKVVEVCAQRTRQPARRGG